MECGRILQVLKRHDKGEVKLMPVILAPSRWKSKVNSLRKIVSYPDKEKSIADYINEDEGWNKVLDKIEEFLGEND